VNPEELPIPKNVQDGLYRLLGEGWDDSANAIYEYIDSQAEQIAALKAALVEERARGDYFNESQECEGYWWDRENTIDITQNNYREMAKGRLAREMPQFDWEDVE
jgi:hypothetical protein